MAIYRGKLPSDGFSLIPTGWIRDSRLSLTAKGVLVLLTSYPSGARITEQQIFDSGRNDDPDEIAQALDDLTELGYLHVGSDGRLRMTGPGRAA